MALTLAANINAATETITVSGTVPGIAIKGFRFAIDNEAMEFRRFAGADEPYPLPTVNTTWIVYRGVNGTSAASHTAGATLYAVRDALTKGADVATVPSPFPSGGTELSTDIVDALEGAASPDAGNVFATMADVGGGGAAVLTAFRTITSAEILALASTPINIVAGVADKVLWPLSVFVLYRPGPLETPYANGSPGNLSLDWLGVGQPKFLAPETDAIQIGAAALAVTVLYPAVADVSIGHAWASTSLAWSVNTPLAVSLTGSNPTDGDGTLDITVAYIALDAV